MFSLRSKEAELSAGVTVRPVEAPDAAAIAAIYAPIVSHTHISFEEQPPSVEEMAGRIAAVSATYPYLVAERDGTLLGYCYGSQHRAKIGYRFSAEVTIYVADSARGQGVGRALYGALLPELGRRGFHAAFAGIALPNAGSVALHEAMGFTHLGVFREVGFKLGAWRDLGWWQRPLVP
jgi:L-amino acid N-acyltransferase YncA